ncbi:hypothetical protein ITI46_32515 [Streptomyces oryzae]|uniref:DUF5667 domain-containing protein n=1 Tax=Streptomyces oryzae TaxID=1434886 RepID=A0ABS3XLZ0_9ACTN|nr:DUF5667 domain-containing protein [Streptomyces oryzae]MBO8196329.1 hypothetical protein [Streptomyces oryzae]
MIGSVPTSRRAIAFAQALDEQERDAGAAADAGPEASPDDRRGEGAPPTDTPHSHRDSHRDDTSDRSLLSLAESLRVLPKPELAPEVKTVQRAQLIAAMEAAFAEGETAARGARFPEQRDARTGSRARGGQHRAPGLGPLGKLRPKSRLGKGLAAGGLSVGVAASAFGGATAASTDALPGDSLYGLKRGMEDLQLDLAGDDADRGSLLLDHASTRLHEARRLMERDRSGELDHEALAEVRRTLSGMRQDASEGHRLLSGAYRKNGDLAPIRSLSAFSKNHRAGWTRLRDRLPTQLHDVSDEVSSVFDAIDHDVSPLRSLLPQERDEAARKREPGTGDRTGEEQPSTSPSSSSTEDVAGRRDGRSEEPSPSDSQREGGGLLGGGLLEPSGQPDREGSPSHSGPGSDGPSTPGSAPEVTLPPIVPDVLPRLGLDGGS